MGCNDDSVTIIPCIANVGVEIIPYILAFVQKLASHRYSFSELLEGRNAMETYDQSSEKDQCTLLKNEFEVMRNCVVPLLFAPSANATSHKRKRDAVWVIDQSMVWVGHSD